MKREKPILEQKKNFIKLCFTGRKICIEYPKARGKGFSIIVVQALLDGKLLGSTQSHQAIGLNWLYCRTIWLLG